MQAVQVGSTSSDGFVDIRKQSVKPRLVLVVGDDDVDGDLREP
jgi:hypothetical protein